MLTVDSVAEALSVVAALVEARKVATWEVRAAVGMVVACTAGWVAAAGPEVCYRAVLEASVAVAVGLVGTTATGLTEAEVVES